MIEVKNQQVRHLPGQVIVRLQIVNEAGTVCKTREVLLPAGTPLENVALTIQVASPSA